MIKIQAGWYFYLLTAGAVRLWSRFFFFFYINQLCTAVLLSVMLAGYANSELKKLKYLLQIISKDLGKL